MGGIEEKRGALETWIDQEGDFDFSRSGGPGGQNVNKVNTRVTLRLSLDSAPLASEEIDRLRGRLANRVTEGDELLLHSSETRSQWRNRELAKRRAVDLILGALKTQKRRRPTRPSAAATRRRLEEKKRRGAKKADRRPPEL
jgi:ribosome-associated protein